MDIFGQGLVEIRPYGDVAECVEEADVEPCAEGAGLSLEIIEVGLCEAEVGGVELGKLVDNEVALAHTLEAADPHTAYMRPVGSVLVVLVVVEHAPHAAVVPPAVALGCDELVGGKLLGRVVVGHRPVGVFEGAVNHALHVERRVVIVFGANGAVELFIEIGATGESDSGNYNRQYISC